MPTLTERKLHRRLERLARRRLDLRLTSNASNYLSFTVRGRPLRVSLHRAFLFAPDEVVRGVGRWLGGREPSCPKVVRWFIDSPPPAAARLMRSLPRTLEPRGRRYDLRRILDRVNARYCGRRVRTDITWGRRRPEKAVRARTLGAYYHAERLIVINPVLDQPAVPEWFVAFTVYHEALHALQPQSEAPHGQWFSAALDRHPRSKAAARWERRHIGLLTRRRTARSRPPSRRPRGPRAAAPVAFALAGHEDLRQYLDF